MAVVCLVLGCVLVPFAAGYLLGRLRHGFIRHIDVSLADWIQHSVAGPGLLVG
ncbi:MAG UNVERIFIED_CONTAM: hypothetical protein LVR18_42255 [Planctomycetaceae bacterium]